MHELKSRGVSDVLVAVVDGLKGFPDATVQTCLVHLIKRSLWCVTVARPHAYLRASSTFLFFGER